MPVALDIPDEFEDHGLMMVLELLQQTLLHLLNDA